MLLMFYVSLGALIAHSTSQSFKYSDPVPGVIRRFGLGDQNERGQRRQQFGMENRK